MVTFATLSKSVGGRPAKSWQLRSVLLIAIFLNSCSARAMNANSSRFAPEVNHPVRSRRMLDFRGETFAAKLFDQRVRQERRHDDQSMARLELADALMDFGEWLDAAANKIAYVETFEFANRRHHGFCGWQVRSSGPHALAASRKSVAFFPGN